MYKITVEGQAACECYDNNGNVCKLGENHVRDFIMNFHCENDSYVNIFCKMLEDVINDFNPSGVRVRFEKEEKK